MKTNVIQVIDCLEGMKSLPTGGVDCCVTDPPYGLRFMNHRWDYDIPTVDIWREVWRVLKPGAHALVACGTRTQHRMAVNIEEAGFEIRDVITWHYGTGFPKSQNLEKELIKKHGSSPRTPREGDSGSPRMTARSDSEKTAPQGNRKGSAPQGPTPSTNKTASSPHSLEGWGTALKPATEFWTLARKPIDGNTVLDNVIKYGTGGLNIDGARIHAPDAQGGEYIIRRFKTGGELNKTGGKWHQQEDDAQAYRGNSKPGRFPANIVLDEFTAHILNSMSGHLQSGVPAGIKRGKTKGIYGKYAGGQPVTGYGDEGGASRFFYVAKASQEERGQANDHPTVKPLSLMTYLIRLVCPVESGRIVLDPFAGSGTTCIAARSLGMDFIAYEINKEYVSIAVDRLQKSLGMFL